MPAELSVGELQPTRLFCPWDSPGKNAGVGCHSLLQGIFPTQGSNPGLLHCRQILYHLSHQGSPKVYIVLVQLSFLQKPKHLTGKLSFCISLGNHGPHHDQRARAGRIRLRAQITSWGAPVRVPTSQVAYTGVPTARRNPKLHKLSLRLIGGKTNTSMQISIIKT